jgi:hypothetical protein
VVAASEAVVGRFIGWYRRTPVSLEFWEGVLTGERLIWCFVGESFKSMLLRADMGTYGREEIAGLTPDAVAEFDDQNVVISIENLQTIRLEPKSWFRRASLTVEWEGGGFELESTRESDSQEALVESLATRDGLAHVDVAIGRSLF